MLYIVVFSFYFKAFILDGTFEEYSPRISLLWKNWLRISSISRRFSGMVRVNVRTPPCAEQPAPALPPLAAHRATTQFQVQGDGGQQHCEQTGLIRCTLVIIVRRSPVIDMSEHSWLRGLLCCPKSPLPLLTPGLVCSSAAPVSDFCWICANVWHHAVVLLMQHGSGPYFLWNKWMGPPSLFVHSFSHSLAFF